MQGIVRMMCRHRRQRHLKERIIKVLFFIGLVVTVVFLYKCTCSDIEFSDTNTYYVETKDTLWDIAEENISDDIDIRDYLDVVYSLNEGLTPDIKCGQAILLPVVR